MLHQKEALICWLLKFVLSCTIINGELHQKMIKSSDKSIKIWCNLKRIFVANKSVLLFWCNTGQNFLECRRFLSCLLTLILNIDFVKNISPLELLEKEKCQSYPISYIYLPIYFMKFYCFAFKELMLGNCDCL